MRTQVTCVLIRDYIKAVPKPAILTAILIHQPTNQQTNHTPQNMDSHNLRILERDGANFIYRNKRLFIGWRNSGIPRAEARLGCINEDEAARDYTNNDRRATTTDSTTTDWLRVYTSSDGPEEMYNGVMGVDEAHPAILHPHVDETAVPSFEQLGAVERLKRVE